MTHLHAVLLPVGPDLYAVPIERIEEVVASPTLTRLVTAPPHVLGLFNLRGQIVPLLDTAALLGGSGIEAATFAVVLQSRQGPIGLAVTDFPEQGVLGDSIGPSDRPGTSGSFRVQDRGQDRVAVLLEPEALLVGGVLAAAGSRRGRRALGSPVEQPGDGRSGAMAELNGSAG